jgi:hypothetical protein
MTQTTVRELTDFFELFNLPFENEWDLTHHPDDYFTILRTVANKTGATGSQRYVDAGTPLNQRLAAVPLDIDFADIFKSLMNYTRKLTTAAGGESASREVGKKAAIRDAFRKHAQSNDPRIAAFIADVFYVEEGLQPDSVNDLNKRILAVCHDIREGIQKCLRYKLLTDPLPVVKGDSKTYSQATTGGKVQFQTPATQSSSSTSTSSTQMVTQPVEVVPPSRTQSGKYSHGVSSLYSQYGE